MAPSPAETCCLSCSLLQGVQVISTYTVVFGSFNMLIVLMGGPKNVETHSVVLATVEFLRMMVHTFALFAGFKGLIGVLLKDVERLRVLLLYHLCSLVLLCLQLVVVFVKGCQELEMLQKLHRQKEVQRVDCSTYQAQLFVSYMLEAGLMSYFAFIIWSLIVRIEAGELGEPSLLREQELADRALGDPWLFVHAPGGESASFLRHERAAPTPFSGIPRNLDEQMPDAAQAAPQAPAPFQGTPYRLE
ncbi:unnamed protein product [Effrenium voratum]|nr:unnamed protein product [Effrenium voratum]CAJ1461065.1 unnamed protein product [Effrenium voratum]